MGVARRVAVGAGLALFVLILVCVVFAGETCDREASEDYLVTHARDRRHFALEVRRGVNDLDFDLRTEGQWDEGLVLSPCDEVKLRALIDTVRSELADHAFRWVRCKDGLRIDGAGVWLR